MDRIILPPPGDAVLRLPAMEDASLILPAPADAVLTLPAPVDAVLTLPASEAHVLVLPASLVPIIPGVAAGVMSGTVTISGAVGYVTATAAGGVAGDGYVVEATASVIVRVSGAVTGAATVSGTAVRPAAGTVTGTGAITGKAVARLAGAVSAAGTLTGTARVVLPGVVSGSATITGTARATTSATGSITGDGTISGVAVRVFVPMGMYLTTTGRYDGSNNTWAQITSMAARTDYPSTVLNSNRLQLITPAPTMLTARAAWSGNGNNVGIAVNGTLVASSSAGTTPQTVTYTYTPAVGDLVALLTNPTNSSVGSRTITSGQTTTYLTAEPA